MLNKILFFWGIAVSAILVIENMVLHTMAYVLWMNSQAYILSLLSIIVWFFTWIWFYWMFKWRSTDEEDDTMNF